VQQHGAFAPALAQDARLLVAVVERDVLPADREGLADADARIGLVLRSATLGAK